MADMKISELAGLDPADAAAGDAVPVADVSAAQTKRSTLANLLDAILRVSAGLLARVGNTLVSTADTLIVRQPAGTAGVDEVQVSHNGTDGLAQSMDGGLYLRPANGIGVRVISNASSYSEIQGDAATLLVGSNSTGVVICGASSQGVLVAGTLTRFGSNHVVGWVSTTDPAGAALDVALARSAAAGVLKVTDGSSGYGSLQLNKLAARGGQFNTGSDTDATLTLLSSSGNYAQFIQTIHSNAADTNFINFYTNDGGGGVTFPDDVTLGISVSDGRLGIGTTPPLATLDVRGSVVLSGLSSTSAARERAGATAEVIDNTDASRKYRLVLSAYDTAAREGLRVWADGAAGRVALAAPASAPTDAHLANGQVSVWLDEATNKLMFRVKYANGTTLKSGEVALT